jgi:CRP-like cAMP-binding protein
LIVPNTTAKNDHDFNSRKILAAIGNGVEVVVLPGKQTVFAQGDAAGAIFYIHEGTVRLTVVSKFGKEVTLSMLSEGEFFGDGSLAGQPLRKESATAMTDCTLLRIDKKAMILALQRDCTLSDLYVAYLLARNLRYHEALVDHLFDPCEKRIARGEQYCSAFLDVEFATFSLGPALPISSAAAAMPDSAGGSPEGSTPSTLPPHLSKAS